MRHQHQSVRLLQEYCKRRKIHFNRWKITNTETQSASGCNDYWDTLNISFVRLRDKHNAAGSHAEAYLSWLYPLLLVPGRWNVFWLTCSLVPRTIVIVWFGSEGVVDDTFERGFLYILVFSANLGSEKKKSTLRASHVSVFEYDSSLESSSSSSTWHPVKWVGSQVNVSTKWVGCKYKVSCIACSCSLS